MPKMQIENIINVKALKKEFRFTDLDKEAEENIFD
jgi:hypothetical protein